VKPLAGVAPLTIAIVLLAAAAPVQAASRAWPAPVTVSDQGGNAEQIALDARGDALAVWNESGADGWRHRYRWYTPGSGWGRAGVLREGGGEPYLSHVWLTPRGEATVLWDERDWQHDAFSTWTATARAGGRFAPLREVSEGTWSGDLQVDDEGGALLVQGQIDRSKEGALLVSTRKPGGDFGPPQRLDSSPGSANAAISPAGAAAVVWSSNSRNTTLLSYRPAGGDFQPPEPIDVPPAPYMPVAINTAGEVVVASSRVDPYTGSHGTSLTVRSPLGTWSPPIAVDAAGLVRRAFAEANGDVSFLSEQPDQSMTLTTRHVDGSVTGPTAIKGAGAMGFSAAMSYGGNMLAAWDEQNGDSRWEHATVSVAERPAGGLFGAPATVSEPGAGFGVPAINDAGAAAVIWGRLTKPGDVSSRVVEAVVRDATEEAPPPPSVRIAGSGARRIAKSGTLTIPVRCSQRCRVRARGLLLVDGKPIAIGRPQRHAKRLRARKVGNVGIRFRVGQASAAGGRARVSVSVTATGRSPRPMTITRRIRLR
jgi:hypothetical protein